MVKSVLNTAVEDGKLRNYVLRKQEVAELIRRTKQQFEEAEEQDRANECDAVLIRLAEDRFNLAVVGQFKRGKSSLMNAILGRDLLPTGLLPLTSAITSLCYGSEERVLLKREGHRFEQEVPLEQLPDYITERGNPGNEKRLIEARVELPVRFLRRGLHFIDTPGVGSAHQENTATTYAFLPEVDAVILVTSVEAPLSETEKGFLQDIRAYARKLFVVVNKIDLLMPTESDEVFAYIRQGIARTLEQSDLKIYPLSSHLGLAAKQNRDMITLQESGLPDFEDALTSFLSEEQARTFLAASLERGLRIIDGIKLTTELHNLQDQMETLRTSLLNGTALSLGLALHDEPPEPSTRAIDKAIERSRSKSSTETSRRPPVSKGRCPICAAQSQAVFDFFAHWQYTFMRSETARRALGDARGFCPVHTWQFERIASPVTVSEGYVLVVDANIVGLHNLLEIPAEEWVGQLEGLASHIDSCAACRVLAETESDRIQQFLERIAHDEIKDRHTYSGCLCLPHLYAVIAVCTDPEISRFLIVEQIRTLEEISEDMRSFSLKRDVLRRDLLNNDETRAWARALLHLVGERTARVC